MFTDHESEPNKIESLTRAAPFRFQAGEITNSKTREQLALALSSPCEGSKSGGLPFGGFVVEEREVEVGHNGEVRLGLWPPASSGPMGSCHLTLARLPASSEAWRLGQFNPLLLSSGYFCGEGGWASCWFPQQPSLARLHCVEGPSWEKQWGKEGRSQPSQGLPFLEVEGAVDTLRE